MRKSRWNKGKTITPKKVKVSVDAKDEDDIDIAEVDETVLAKVESKVSNIIANFENNIKVDVKDSRDSKKDLMKSKVENALTLLMSNGGGGSPTPKKRTSKKRLNHPRTPQGTKSLMDFWKRKEKENF